MVVTRIAARPGELDLGGRRIERVRLDAEGRTKTHQRVVTDQGTEIGISLPRGTVMNPGDVLYADADRAVVVEAVKEDVLVIRPRTPLEWGLAGFHLGNRHCQPFFRPDAVLVRYDHTLEQLLEEIGIGHERGRERLVGLRPVGHSH